MPAIYEHTEDGKAVLVDAKNLFAFEKSACEALAAASAPDEIFVLAWSGSSIILEDPAKVTTPRGLIVVEVKGASGALRTSMNFGKTKRERKLDDDEVRAIHAFVEKNKVDSFPRLDAERTVKGTEVVVASGRVYVFLHLTQRDGNRVWINNPPTADDTEYAPDDPLWRYSKLVDCFMSLSGVEK